MPKLYGDKATKIPILDEYAYARWPHAFTIWATRYKVPDHFLITLLYLWDATVGAGDACGDLAIGQVPVRVRTVRKWLAAFCAAGFFKEEKRPAGDKRGSFFIYNEQTTPEAWEQFFDMAARAEWFGGWDKLSPQRFGNWFARAAGNDVPLTDDEKEFRQKGQTAMAAVAAEAKAR